MLEDCVLGLDSPRLDAIFQLGYANARVFVTRGSAEWSKITLDIIVILSLTVKANGYGGVFCARKSSNFAVLKRLRFQIDTMFR